MKLQPEQHGSARPPPFDVEGVSVDARLAVHAQATVTVMPLSAAELRIIQLAFFLPKVVKKFRQGTQGAVVSRIVNGTRVGRLGRRRPSTPSLCARHDELCLVGKRSGRLLAINRISVPIIRAHAASTWVGKCIASRYRQWNIAS
ncbi:MULTISPECIES: hypothetical protein [Bradyrhizobium]|uniref:Uncharacterized protein n=1 Tax=Bradyrhizobium yuanmingense TaxID=108015 RepID=A0A1C3XEV2_9BRAD|nr:MULTISPECIES: hypothetical protein [Bradyrhizobium]MDA9545169.1 hypothetical protein [Bradyrhizobium sp. CCBAU 45321]MCA1543520.1 hypothetical protein [Bradyrhizobium sp. NBAIM32]RQH04534.1 hypothetical protein EHH60_33730 [Bradyrhizobium sp. RP6]TWI19265.1 hypothetical protein IQ15_06888 [Bradyrhizobium yuanmingense]UWU93471.1 hypothetical protein N2604_05830 [Bradyrhizobium sp. CB1015]